MSWCYFYLFLSFSFENQKFNASLSSLNNMHNNFKRDISLFYRRLFNNTSSSRNTVFPLVIWLRKKASLSQPDYFFAKRRLTSRGKPESIANYLFHNQHYIFRLKPFNRSLSQTMLPGNHLGDSGWTSVFHCPDLLPDIIKAIRLARLYTLGG